jgi:hypothetical protein
MRKYTFKKLRINLCPWWQGFFVFILLITAIVLSEPAISMSTNSDNTGKFSVKGFSMVSIKKATISIEYSPAIDIEKALIGSPISAIAVGVSINRDSHLLHVDILTTKQVTIDGVILFELQVPLGSSVAQNALVIKNASLTDAQGVVHQVNVIPQTEVAKTNSRIKEKSLSAPLYYMLNGRKMSGNLSLYSKTKALRTEIQFGIVKR